MAGLYTRTFRYLRRLAKAAFPSLAASVQRWLNERNQRHFLEDHRHWDERIRDVISCPDNTRLPRVANAGCIINGIQVMHNGIEVIVDGYYGNGITRMLAANGGCHEPQEEVVFESIVRSLPPGAVMIEAGAYWAFYSIWFCKTIPQARAYLIEPEKINFDIGKQNFAHNNCQGEFSHGYVGALPGRADDGLSIIAIDEFTAERGLDHVHLLHADVQGAELELLTGSKNLLSSHAVDYLFISTHTMELHSQCIDALQQHGYRILASVDMTETYSVDGILVACSPTVTPPVFEHPSKKPKHYSTR